MCCVLKEKERGSQAAAGGSEREGHGEEERGSQATAGGSEREGNGEGEKGRIKDDVKQPLVSELVR